VDKGQFYGIITIVLIGSLSVAAYLSFLESRRKPLGMDTDEAELHDEGQKSEESES
jgi:hypothetical protein